MQRSLIGACLASTVALTAGGCDNGTQARLIATYRAADFAASTSDVTRSSVKLSTSFDLGHAYEVTSRRIEYASVIETDGPPIDDFGELIRPSYAIAADPTLVDENGEPVTGRREGGTLEAELPARVLGSGRLYYRWVLEYSSGGDRLTMRKSDIFRVGAERAEQKMEDERVSF